MNGNQVSSVIMSKEFLPDISPSSKLVDILFRNKSFIVHFQSNWQILPWLQSTSFYSYTFTKVSYPSNDDHDGCSDSDDTIECKLVIKKLGSKQTITNIFVLKKISPKRYVMFFSSIDGQKQKAPHDPLCRCDKISPTKWIISGNWNDMRPAFTFNNTVDTFGWIAGSMADKFRLELDWNSKSKEYMLSVVLQRQILFLRHLEEYARYKGVSENEYNQYIKDQHQHHNHHPIKKRKSKGLHNNNNTSDDESDEFGFNSNNQRQTVTLLKKKVMSVVDKQDQIKDEIDENNISGEEEEEEEEEEKEEEEDEKNEKEVIVVAQCTKLDKKKNN